MADSRRVKRSIKQLQRVKTWQLLIMLVLMLFVAAALLRLNNVGMLQLRDAVLSADKSGSETAISNNLATLQRYSASHMNADTGTFYLEGQYKRNSQDIVDAATAASGDGSSVYAKADEVCRPQFTHYSPAYLQCFSSEVDKYPAASMPVDKVQLPDPSLYAHSFISPRWSPDFAGLAVLICAVIIAVIIGRLVSLGILHLLLRRHYKSI